MEDEELAEALASMATDEVGDRWHNGEDGDFNFPELDDYRWNGDNTGTFKLVDGRVATVTFSVQ